LLQYLLFAEPEIVHWTGLSKQTIHNRLNVLVAAGHVEKVRESGLYEPVADPPND